MHAARSSHVRVGVGGRLGAVRPPASSHPGCRHSNHHCVFSSRFNLINRFTLCVQLRSANWTLQFVNVMKVRKYVSFLGNMRGKPLVIISIEEITKKFMYKRTQLRKGEQQKNRTESQNDSSQTIIDIASISFRRKFLLQT